MPKAKKEATSTPEESFGQVDIVSKDPRTVVLMLDSPEPLVQAKACEALLKYMQQSENNIKEMIGCDLLPRLVKLLGAAEKGLRAHTVMCLAASLSSFETRLQVGKLNGVHALLKLLEPEEEAVIHERASFAISSLAEDFSLKIQLNKEGAVQPLLRMLHSPTADTQRNSAKALELLTRHYECRTSLMEADGLQAMLELLSSEYAPIQELGLRTVDNCMLDTQCRASFRELGGLEKIVEFIGNKDYADLHVVALSVLARCLEDTQNMQALQSSGCLNKLLEHVKDSSSAELKQNAAMALSLAAKNDLNCKILHEQEVETVLLELLDHEHEGVAGAGAEGLAAMAKLMSSRQRVGQNSGVTKLVALFSREQPETRAAGAKALASVISGVPTNCILVSECDGVEPLAALLEETHAGCIKFAAQCVSAVSINASLRSQCFQAEVISKLVHHLTHLDGDVLCSCADALSSLACDTEARRQFVKCGGVAQLLPLLSHPRREVQRSACDTLALCARDNEVATAAIQLGALNVLEELSGSSSRGSVSCNAALAQLLSSNLSAKYRLTGRLDYTDVVTHGFYDTGPAKGSEDKFLSIKELSERPLEINQPIFYVSLARPPSAKKADEDPVTDTTLTGKGKKTKADKDKADKGSKETKGQGKKVKQDAEKEEKAPVESSASVTAVDGSVPPDAELWTHLQFVQNEVQGCPTTREQLEKLGRYVSDAMGGPVPNMSAFHYELSLAESQHDLRSNLLPLGLVKKGAHRHRALLFKVLCDQLAVGCTLVRGEYNRYWNQVVVMAEDDPSCPVPRKYLVDLVHHPGRLLLEGSAEANQYTKL